MKEEGASEGLAHRATLKDVAARANVSINTASVVLNPRRNQVVVHPDTRARVESAARALGYRRNLAASRLAGGAANTLAILTDRMTNFFHSVILDAFEAEASRQGFQCMLGCTAPADPRKLDYLSGLGAQGVDGFVLVPVWTAPEIHAIMPRILHEDTRVVFIDNRFPGNPGPLVACDHRAGARLLAQHLSDQGHRAVTFAQEMEQAGTWSVEERIAGAREIFGASGVEVVTAQSMDAEAAARPVWEKLQAPDRPTAVMCSNDHLAFSLIAGLNRAGFQAPGKLAITGFDDVNHYLPDLLEFPRDLPFPWEMPLTTLRQPMEEIGKCAAQLLVDIIRGKAPVPGTDILLPGTLVPRGLTAHRI